MAGRGVCGTAGVGHARARAIEEEASGRRQTGQLDQQLPNPILRAKTAAASAKSGQPTPAAQAAADAAKLEQELPRKIEKVSEIVF
jgi:hypothetical protein